MVGKTLDHYHPIEKTVQGGMGEVCRAFDAGLERDGALKVLPAGTLNRNLLQGTSHQRNSRREKGK